MIEFPPQISQEEYLKVLLTDPLEKLKAIIEKNNDKYSYWVYKYNSFLANSCKFFKYFQELERKECDIEKCALAKYIINRLLFSYPNLNHLFQTCEKGTLAEYGQLEETINPEVLKDIIEWIRKQ